MTVPYVRTRLAFILSLSITASAAVALAPAKLLGAPLLQEEPEPEPDEESEAQEAPTRPDRVAAAHIIVSFADAPNALPGVSRSKDEALARAKEALAKARAEDAEFDKIVLEYSDDPRGKLNGGKIGILVPGRLRDEFRPLEAVFDVEVGGFTEPVETPLGFHVLTRLEIIEYAASHILIRYAGSDNAPPDVERTKEEAKELAEEIAAKAKAAGSDFAALAMEYSEGPTAPRGGSLGIFNSGDMVQPFEKALARIETGEVTGPVETRFGYHVIRRDPIERVRASHILIQYAGSRMATAEITRSKEEAKALAESLRDQAREEDADFAALARENSEGPSAPRGGDLGLFERGAMVPEFSDTAFALDVGQVSDVVETPFGYHVILRTE